jgi:putative flippase GtrA
MKETLQKAWPHAWQFARYIVSGGLAAVLDLGSFFLLRPPYPCPYSPP